MKRDIKINKETSEQFFEDWLEAMDIYIDIDELDAEEKSNHFKIKGKVVRAIMWGDLEFNDEGQAVYTPVKTPDHAPITFGERKGSSLVVTDKNKKGHDVAKMYAMLAEMTGLSSVTFSKLKGIDIKLVEAVFNFLMD